MKIKLFTIVLCFLSLSMSSQETILDKVSKETCEYLGSDEIKNLKNSEKTLKLGVFIIGLYTKYKTELKKEGITFDAANGRDSGRELGEKIGMNMVNFCPEVLIALAAQDDDKFEEKEELTKEKFEVITGKIVSVKGNEYSTLVVKDDNGKTQKFLWLSNFKGSDKLIETKKPKNLKVKVSYINLEVYSPKLKEYVVRKQIVEIEYL
ncbi:MAG: hypothetical protein JXR05_02755 [Flavobacteriaceae bacterium]